MKTILGLALQENIQANKALEDKLDKLNNKFTVYVETISVKIFSMCTKKTSLKSLVTSDPNKKIWLFTLQICDDKIRKTCSKNIICSPKHIKTRNNQSNNPIETLSA